MKRRAGLAAAAAAEEAAAEAASAPVPACWLCERPLGTAVEWHHPIPKGRGGRATVPVHPICHRMIHAETSNAELAAASDRAALLARPGIARFVTWVADKPSDFWARVRRSKQASGS